MFESDTIKANIRRRIELTEEEEKIFVSYLKPLKIKRKTFFLRAGEVCGHSAYVINGCLRGYSTDHNGFEHVLQFAPEDWWIADMYSLLSGAPGDLNIDALEDTEVFLLSKEHQEELYTKIPRFERFFRLLVEKSLVSFRQRILENMSATAQERYALFCSRYPTLIHRMPQKQVAAYIGVTPEFLSKIKSDWLRKKE